MNASSSALDSFESPITALVQGASRGIGLALVRRLVDARGVSEVIATCRDPEHADDLRDLQAGGEERLTLVRLDATDEASIEAAAREVGGIAPGLDLLINCAGLLHDGDEMRPERRLADVDPGALARAFAVNASGPLLVAKHFEGLFDAKRRAVFASISARVGSIGDNRLGGWYAYRASKAAQNMITRNLSIELRRRHRGIICVAMHPGTVDTGLSKPFQSGVPEGKLFGTDRAADQLLSVIDGLVPQSNGKFLAWDGSEIPW